MNKAATLQIKHSIAYHSALRLCAVHSKVRLPHQSTQTAVSVSVSLVDEWIDEDTTVHRSAAII